MRSTETEPSVRSAATFDELQLAMLFEQVQRFPIAKLLVTMFIGGLAYPAAPRSLFTGWAIFFVGVQLIRWHAFEVLIRNRTLSTAARLDIGVALTVLDGIGTGACVGLFPFLPELERALVSAVLTAFCAGAVTTTAAHSRVFLAFMLPILAPLALMWALYPVNDAVLTGVGMATLIAVFMYVIYERSAHLGRVVHESFRMRHERAELNKELQGALESAEAASRAKTRFLACASHDLRQPIQTLSLFAAALAMRPLDDRSRKIADNMNAALHDLTDELNALLDVSKLDAGVVRIHAEKLRLDALLTRVRQAFATAAEKKGLTLRVHCPPDAWTCSDRTHLERVIRNLVENAIKYTDRGEVSIDAIRDGDRFCIGISDTGCGIAKDEQKRVFEEFYQIGNPERDRKRGLGLGLSIVQRLTAMLDIPLQLESTLELGTRITLWLPATLTGEEAAVPAAVLNSVALHVLVIDDEQGVREGMQALLEELGCTVCACASTDEAVQQAKQKQPDILLTDFRLRGADNGIAAIHALRKLMPGLPALIVTGDSAPERLQEAQLAGVAMIYKPVSSETLLRKVIRVTAATES